MPVAGLTALSAALRTSVIPLRVPQHFYYSYKWTHPPFLLPLPAPQE